MATTDDVAESQVVASSSSSTSLGDSSLVVQRAIDHLVSENKLSASEKEHLEKLIQQGDAEILKALELLSTSEQIEEQILSFLRRFRDQKMEDVSVDPLESMNKACAVMCTEADNNAKISSTKRALKHISKVLKSLKNNPSKAKNRMILKNNFANQKFIMKTPGAVALLHAIGFSDTEDEKGVEILQIDEADCSTEKLEKAMELCDQTMERLVPIKADAPRIKCKTCDFWGDPQYDGLCSLCNKNKIHGRSPEKEKEKPKPAAEPIRCTNGCGFFGSPENQGMCSSCFKNKYPEKAAEKAAEKAKETEVPKKHWRAKFKTALVKIDAMRRFQKALATAQKDKTRCWQCKKKIGLMGIQCKCRYFFCGKHRSTLDHACSYDYKTDFERILKAANPIIEARKFDKIDD